MPKYEVMKVKACIENIIKTDNTFYLLTYTLHYNGFTSKTLNILYVSMFSVLI